MFVSIFPIYLFFFLFIISFDDRKFSRNERLPEIFVDGKFCRLLILEQEPGDRTIHGSSGKFRLSFQTELGVPSSVLLRYQL